MDAQGNVVERQQRGEPFVFRRGLGMVPIDPQHPLLDDGSAVAISTLGYHDEAGRWHRVIRYQRLPGPGPEKLNPRYEVVPRLSPQQQANALADLLSDPRPLLPLAIELRDTQPAKRLPPRAMTRLAFAEHHRVDRLTPLRRKQRAANQARRVREAGPIRAWIRSVGGTVEHHATLYGSVLHAWVPRTHLAALLAQPELVRVEVSPPEGTNESSLTTDYLCTNLPTRWNFYRDTDAAACEPALDLSTFTWDVPCAYLDAVNAATGTLEYVDAGYDGEIDGGNANWGHPPLRPTSSLHTLTYGIRDWQPLEANHPAFLRYNHSRFLFVVDESSTRSFDIYDEWAVASGPIPRPIETSSEASHTTRCAAVAIANPTVSSEPELTLDEALGARSGVARMVSGLASTGDIKTNLMLDYINGGALGVGPDGEPWEGIDAISSSAKEAHGEWIEGAARDGGSLHCASSFDARGLDIVSRSIVYAFSNDGVVYTKAGGNDHDLIAGVCRVPKEVSPPGASPAAIPSGSLDTFGMTASEIQGVAELHFDSNRGTTLDGRAYPLLTCISQTCGVASAMDSFLGEEDGYEKHGQTSATAPRVAGSALVFKHWYLEQVGSLANHPGRIIVNVLNFADGFAMDGSSRVQAQDLPYPGWGLGRLRLRLYSDPQDWTGPQWGTHSYVVWTGSVTTIDITGGTGELPKGLRHLRITAWWLEVNTGALDTKAHITLSLSYTGSSGRTRTQDADNDGIEQALRIQFDRDDDTFRCPPSGPVTLTLTGVDVPWEARSAYEPGGPIVPWRIVYVAWFWEIGEDPTTITCPGAAPTVSTRCSGTSEPDTSDPGDAYSLTADEAADLRTRRLAAERAIRETLRIATGVAPGTGCGPVFEARG